MEDFELNCQNICYEWKQQITNSSDFFHVTSKDENESESLLWLENYLELEYREKNIPEIIIIQDVLDWQLEEGKESSKNREEQELFWQDRCLVNTEAIAFERAGENEYLTSNSKNYTLLTDGIITANKAKYKAANLNVNNSFFLSSLSIAEFVSLYDASTLDIERIFQSINYFWPGRGMTIELNIIDLPPGQLAEAEITSLNGLGYPNSGTITIDADGNGRGWFVDPTPLDNSEFPLVNSGFNYQASNFSPANNKYDLLTTILHETGHLLGMISGYKPYDKKIQYHNSLPTFVGNDFTAILSEDRSHLDSKYHSLNLMNDRLELGVRKLPSPLELKISAEIATNY